MKFGAHQTFSIRENWLSKGMRAIYENPRFFVDKNIDAACELGVGSAMAKAIRYYLRACGLADEKIGAGMTFTHFGRRVFARDKYLQRHGTLAMLHLNLSRNVDFATSFYIFFNEYLAKEVDAASFFIAAKKFALQNGANPAERSISDDFACILQTYLPRECDDLESNLECPLARLGILRNARFDDRQVCKTPVDLAFLPDEIALAAILSNEGGSSEIKISRILNAKKSLGRIFNFGSDEILELLERLSSRGFLRIVRTANVENVEISPKFAAADEDALLGRYYGDD